jgi:hypothetical protein
MEPGSGEIAIFELPAWLAIAPHGELPGLAGNPGSPGAMTTTLDGKAPAAVYSQKP